MAQTIDPETLAAAVMAGDRAALARAVTLVESTHPRHRPAARALMRAIGPGRTSALRLGVTGIPGVGKSTFIDAFGLKLVRDGHRVAVLAVDPTSTRTGGSILGDKTRMARLAAEPGAFIRPSPAGSTLGGVAARTREAILLCEAAGFDIVLVETVGVGQSETAVADLVDCFLLLALVGAGDELQGIKKGILEHADVVAITKADGPNIERARLAAAELKGALNIVTAPDRAGVSVLAVSALAGTGLDDVWRTIEAFAGVARQSGALERRRAAQAVRWFHTLVEEAATARLREPTLRRAILRLEDSVRAGLLAPVDAADEVGVSLAGP